MEQHGEEEGCEPNSTTGSNSSSKAAVLDPPEVVGEKGGETIVVLTTGGHADETRIAPVLSVVISQPEEAPSPKAQVFKAEGKEKAAGAVAAKTGCLLREDSYHEQCRVCQQPSEEALVDLGCRCRGDLAKAHRSCIDAWFHTRGSNKCEICQQVAKNIPSPQNQASTNYWVWRVNSTYGGGRGEQQRACLSPLWVAFAILIGGLLLDVLISVSLGVSALPVNIIIGVLIVLGLGTALRLALECCQEWGSRRSVQGSEMNIAPGYSSPV